jgi:hypothetical protein
VVRDEDEVGQATPAGSTVERGLFNSALDFYGAADAVIDYSGSERPRLRYDVAGLQAVRAAMGELELRISLASRAGMPAQRIAQITRLEQEVVDLILRRQDDSVQG